MQSQTRNLIVFVATSVVIFGGYTWLRYSIWPPPPRLTVAQLATSESVVRLFSAPVGAGLADAIALTVQAATTEPLAAEYAVAERTARAAAVAKAAPKPIEPAKAGPPPSLVALGGDDYFLRVRLTTLGAGVDQVVLTQFREADEWGLPAKMPDGQPKPLELIPTSTEPSFAIYHYARPESDEERPLDTLGRRVWTAGPLTQGDGEQSISFTTELPEQSVRLVKTYSLRKRDYHIGLSVRVERLADAKDAKPFRYQLMGGHGLPIEGKWYTNIFRNALVGWVGAANRVERVVEDNRSIFRSAGSQRFQRLDRKLQYAAVTVQYFASAIVVDDQQEKQNFLEFVRATDEGSPEANKPQFDDITVRAVAEPVDPKPGEAVEHKYLLYHGPVKVRLLGELRGEQAVDPALVERYETTLHLNSFTDYGGWGIWTNTIIFFTNIVHWLVARLRPIVRYDAICIVVVTVIVRGFMFPLSRKQAATMQRTQEQMAKLQPEIKKVKEKYKGDVLEQQKAMSELYRKHGVNPAAGLGGCLMLLVQMPVFLGLYFALQESFFFRLEPFLWIRNLAAPDMLIWWTDKIPIISDPSQRESLLGVLYLGPYFNLLPVVAVTLMMIQQKIMTPPPADEQAEMQQKMMKYMMLVFGLMFYRVPAGLCLYFIASTGWGIAERKLIPKKKVPEPGSVGAMTGRTGAGPRGRGKSKPEAPPSKLRAWWEKLLKDASKK